LFLKRRRRAHSHAGHPPPPFWPPSRDPIGLQPFSKCPGHFRSDSTLFPQFGYHKQPTFVCLRFPLTFCSWAVWPHQRVEARNLARALSPPNSLCNKVSLNPCISLK